MHAVADPGFPRGGGANSQGGAPTYDFVNFCRKLHENEEILAPGGGRASPAPPLRSATGMLHVHLELFGACVLTVDQSDCRHSAQLYAHVLRGNLRKLTIITNQGAVRLKPGNVQVNLEFKDFLYLASVNIIRR